MMALSFRWFVIASLTMSGALLGAAAGVDQAAPRAGGKSEGGIELREKLLGKIESLQNQLQDLYRAEVDAQAFSGSFYQWLSEASTDSGSVPGKLLRDLEDHSGDLAQVSRSLASPQGTKAQPGRDAPSGGESDQVRKAQAKLSELLADFQRDAPLLTDSERESRWGEIQNLQEKVRVLQRGGALADSDSADLNGDHYE